MSRTNKSSFVSALLMILTIWGCESPLAVDVPRKETPLTAAPKVQPTSITPDFVTDKGDYIFVNTPDIQVDTTVSPMRFWMDFEMGVLPDTLNPLIQAFRINLDSIPSDGLIADLVYPRAQMLYDNGTGSGPLWISCDLNSNTVSIVIAEKERVLGQPREVEVYIYLIANKDKQFPVPQEQLLGVIHLVI